MGVYIYNLYELKKYETSSIRFIFRFKVTMLSIVFYLGQRMTNRESIYVNGRDLFI
jgi:hypothetical protein